MTSDVFADSKRDRENKVLDKRIEKDGEHGKKAQEIKNELNNESPRGDPPSGGGGLSCEE